MYGCIYSNIKFVNCEIFQSSEYVEYMLENHSCRFHTVTYARISQCEVFSITPAHEC